MIQTTLIKPTEQSSNVAWLEHTLRQSRGWLNARQLLILLGEKYTEDAAREVRRWAAASDQVISGDDGYCHVRFVKLGDCQHAVARLQSQGKSIGKRVQRWNRILHALLSKSTNRAGK